MTASRTLRIVRRIRAAAVLVRVESGSEAGREWVGFGEREHVHEHSGNTSGNTSATDPDRPTLHRRTDSTTAEQTGSVSQDRVRRTTSKAGSGGRSGQADTASAASCCVQPQRQWRSGFGDDEYRSGQAAAAAWASGRPGVARSAVNGGDREAGGESGEPEADGRGIGYQDARAAFVCVLVERSRGREEDAGGARGRGEESAGGKCV